MTGMYKENFGVKSMTAEQLDLIVTDNSGVVGTVYRFDTLIDLSIEALTVHGYGFRWIGTKGYTDRGKLIVLPKSQRTRALIKEAKICELVTYGFPRNYAELLAPKKLSAKVLVVIYYYTMTLDLSKVVIPPKCIPSNWMRWNGDVAQALNELTEEEFKFVTDTTKELYASDI